MDRRHLLRVLGAAAAAAGLPVDVFAALDAPGRARTARRAWFTPPQRDALTAMVDALIPTTDTPGAVEAGVVDFLEVVVSEWMGDERRRTFMTGLADAMERAGAAPAPSRMDDVAPSTWVEVLRDLERQGDDARATDPDARSFFHDLRSLTLQGYYTSEVGMTEELWYRPLPGRFEGCAELSDVARPAPGAG